LKAFLSSRQNRNEFGFTDLLNKVYNIVFVLSLAGIVLMLVLGSINQEKLIPVFLIFLFSVLVNAWVAATFANSIDRLGCKMVWLIPLLLIIGAMGIVSNNQKLNRTKA
jgi:hypothetical protein